MVGPGGRVENVLLAWLPRACEMAPKTPGLARPNTPQNGPPILSRGRSQQRLNGCSDRLCSGGKWRPRRRAKSKRSRPRAPTWTKKASSKKRSSTSTTTTFSKRSRTDEALDEDDDDIADLDEEEEEEEAEEILTPSPAAVVERSGEGEDEEEEEEPDDEDVEASLDVILKERLVVEDEPEDEEATDQEDKTEGNERVLPKQPDEFVCRSCFLVKHPSQLADKKKMLCRDCV